MPKILIIAPIATSWLHASCRPRRSAFQDAGVQVGAQYLPAALTQRKVCARGSVPAASPRHGLAFAVLTRMNQPIPPKILVVYFSRSGHTRKVAQAIAQAAHADLEELRETRSRRGLVGWLRSDYEAAFQLSAHPLPLMHDLRNYQVVFVGGPTWHSALSSPVRGFLEQNGTTLNDVALFATYAEPGADETLAQMTDLLPRPPLAVLRISESDVRRGPAVEVGEFVESSLVAWETRHRRS
jgi:hypothetical protein